MGWWQAVVGRWFRRAVSLICAGWLPHDRVFVGNGPVESSGSLERHDLNKLALYHLEGGALRFKRPTRKLALSVV